MSTIYTMRAISHDEACEVAQRLVNSHFRKEPHARMSIPARPDYDDDLVIFAYIEQQRAKDGASACGQSGPECPTCHRGSEADKLYSPYSPFQKGNSKKK